MKKVFVHSPQFTQSRLTRAHLTQAATILSNQRVADSTALVASISTMAKAAFTAQFLPWSSEDLLALDVPLNRTFRRLLRLPPSHGNALLYIGTTDRGLGLPRLSDQINLRKWSILCRLQERGGLPALAIGGLLTRAAASSGGQFIIPQQGDFIGPHSATPVWGSSLGALGPDTTLYLSPTLGPVAHPLLRPIVPPRAGDSALLRALHRLDLSTWEDLTTRAPDGSRSWLDLPNLLPELRLTAFPPAPHTWPGEPSAIRPGQFWRLAQGPGDWAWGGINQVLRLHPDNLELYVQRWIALPARPGRLRDIARAGHPTILPVADFTARCTHRLLVMKGRSPHKGAIRLEIPDTWSEPFRQLLPRVHSWSVYADASWKAATLYTLELRSGYKVHTWVGEHSSFPRTYPTGARTSPQLASRSLRLFEPWAVPPK